MRQDVSPVSLTSAPSTRLPLPIVREGLTVKFADHPDLVEKHKYYIDMLQWEIPMNCEDKPEKIPKYELNPGTLDASGN